MQPLTVAQQQCCGKTGDNDHQVVDLETLSESQALDVACSLERNDAKSADGDCLTAEASWGFTSFDEPLLDVLCCNSDSLELGASNRAGMVSAGCGCCPADEAALVFGLDRERVLGVDLFDVLPADFDSTERVHDGDTLVSDNQLGANEPQPGQRHHEGAPRPGRQVLPIANQDAQGNQSDNCCQSDAAPRSKNLHVSHVSIIAGDVK
jgi:hypothetical protein